MLRLLSFYLFRYNYHIPHGNKTVLIFFLSLPYYIWKVVNYLKRHKRKVEA